MKGTLLNGFQLGDWRAYPLRNTLIGPSGETHVEPKAMQLLERLAQARSTPRLLYAVSPGKRLTASAHTPCA